MLEHSCTENLVLIEIASDGKKISPKPSAAASPIGSVLLWDIKST